MLGDKNRRCDRHSGNGNLSNFKLTRKKQISGLKRDSNPWPLHATLGAGQFVEFIFSNREQNEIWNKYEQNRTEVFLFAGSKFCGKVVFVLSTNVAPL